ncbi:MAG: alpha-amylase [Lachnospiraceae bacterium]|nr:alpha-amylase [Lachnospiraceae bacterium]
MDRLCRRKNEVRLTVILVLICVCTLAGCGSAQPGTGIEQESSSSAGVDVGIEPSDATGTDADVTDNSVIADTSAWKARPLNVLDDKYRTFYEIFVYSFYDSNQDGIGDLQGVIQKLDYLNDGDVGTNTDLGINGIWLMPIMPSTTYHKYDTKDYMDIDPEYGTMADFEQLLAECHERGINVIIDLAMNHSSSQHPWFLEATNYLKQLPEGKEPDMQECPYLDYYHFSKEAKSGYAQVIGAESWYYEAQFWSEMPDLNLKSPAVREEFEEIARFWLDKGVDGFRLDAVKEYVTGSVEENVEILTWFNDAVKAMNSDTYLVCECWTDRATYSRYYASGVDSMFAFEFADKSGIISNVVNGRQKASTYGKMQVEANQLHESYHADYVDAPFYTNHDLARSAGYYAGENSVAQTKIGHALNLLTSGNVFLYYGEELGMKGSGKDENKRAPMYWSKNPDAVGMCDGPADMENVKMKFDSLEEQAGDVTSVYNYVKDVIRLRNQNPEISRGEVTFHEEISSDTVCVISKEYEGNHVVLIFNISAETSEVDLSKIVQGAGGDVENVGVSDSSKMEVNEMVVLGELLTGEETIERNEDVVTMPPYSVLVLGK